MGAAAARAGVLGAVVAGGGGGFMAAVFFVHAAPIKDIAAIATSTISRVLFIWKCPSIYESYRFHDGNPILSGQDSFAHPD
jgi:hypothetical protein